MEENQTPLSEDERKEGLLEGGDALTLTLTDEEILQIIGKRVEDSKAYWNKVLDLDNIRKEAEKYYWNKPFDKDSLYDYQIPYKDNRIFIAIETLLPLVTTNPPQPIAGEAEDTQASRELSKNLETAHLALYEDLYLKAKLQGVVRHLLMGMRLGVLKYHWDTQLGPRREGKRVGGIAIDVVRPTRIVIDQNTQDINNPPLVAEFLTTTVEGLAYKFPEKKDELYKSLGIPKGQLTGLGREIGYQEIWFSYFNKEGEREEGVCWRYKSVLLDKMKNPHFNYDEPELNFFDAPKKPYIFFSHLNTGRYPIDDTSFMDQAIPQQDIINKIGRLIAENADQAGAGIVYNTEMLSQETASKLIGDPTEKVGVKGSVRDAIARLPYNQLQQYVYNLQIDARGEIDNLFGASAPLRGEKTDIKTLGQEVLAQRSNMGRMQSLADAIEDGADKLYKGLTQMMKVFWDEPTLLKFIGEGGKTTFMEFSRDKIEDGMTIRVKAGSAMPKDRMSEKNDTIQLAEMLDPLSIAEGLDKKDPKEWAKRVVYYRFFMDRYVKEVLEVDDQAAQDEQALADIKLVSEGQQPTPPEEVTKEYLATYQNFINSPEFKELPPEVQTAHLQYMRTLVDIAKQSLKMAPEGAPSGSEAQPTEMAPTEEAPPEAPQGGLGGLMSKIGGLFR